MDLDDLVSDLTPEIAKALVAAPDQRAQRNNAQRNAKVLAKLAANAARTGEVIFNIVKTNFPARYEPFESLAEAAIVHDALNEMRQAHKHLSNAVDLVNSLGVSAEVFATVGRMCELVQLNARTINGLSDSVAKSGDVIGAVMERHFAGAPKGSLSREDLAAIHAALHEVLTAAAHVQRVEAHVDKLPERLHPLTAEVRGLIAEIAPKQE